MAFLQVNVGNIANDGSGDTIRTAFTKINSNFANIDSIANLEAIISDAGNISSAIDGISNDVANVEANVTLLQSSAYTDSNVVTLLDTLSSNVNTAFYLKGFSVNTTHSNVTSTAYVGGNLTAGNVNTGVVNASTFVGNGSQLSGIVVPTLPLTTFAFQSGEVAVPSSGSKVLWITGKDYDKSSTAFTVNTASTSDTFINFNRAMTAQVGLGLTLSGTPSNTGVILFSMSVTRSNVTTTWYYNASRIDDVTNTGGESYGDYRTISFTSTPYDFLANDQVRISTTYGGVQGLLVSNGTAGTSRLTIQALSV